MEKIDEDSEEEKKTVKNISEAIFDYIPIMINGKMEKNCLNTVENREIKYKKQNQNNKTFVCLYC